jgi:polyhydroxybutyrate depolymerase
MSELADTEGFVVLYPNGVPLIAGQVRSHNGGSCCPRANERASPTDDVGFAEALIERVEARLAAEASTLDRRRIYSTGMSNGGFMSIRLGCQSANIFAAVGSVTGVLGNEDPQTDEFPCDLESTQGLPIPYFHIHGTADPTVPYNGNGGGFKSVAETVQTFRGLNACPGGPGVPGYSNGPVSCESWCPDDANNVTLCTIQGGQHVWFGPNCNSPGCAEIDSTALMWRFFERHRRELQQS